jgi:hypothetical protein
MRSDLFALLTQSYERLVGAPLPGSEHGPDWLYNEAPYALLAHNTNSDPVFMYANRTAQRCFEYSWEEITALPSRLSAEAPNRAERQRLLDEVSQRGYVTGYSGIRIAKSGRRFQIEGGVVWQLVDESGRYHGQAATFDLPTESKS